jgi:beta-lactamase class A
MSSRRPYASRGVPRRALTRRFGGGGLRSSGALFGIVSIILVGAAATWYFEPFAPDASPLSGVPLADAPTPQPPVLQMGNVAPDRAPTIVAAPTVESTLRHWDLNSDPLLASQLDRALVGVDGQIGIAVKDLGSGRGAILDGDLELQSASLYKLPVLYTVFASGVGLSEDLPITDDALSYDAGTMELGVGEMLTVAEALERMVTLSDNTSAIMLASRVGPNRINANIVALGMDTTHYSLERMTTSALDMLHLVQLMADGQAVSPAASGDMLHLMLRQRVNDRLPRLLPDDVQVAHKTGNLPGTVNDVGVLYGPTSTLAIAALVSDTTDETAAATAIARVGLAAYSYFQEQPEVADRPLIPPAPSRPIPPVWRQPRPTPTPEPTLEPTEVPVIAAVPTGTPVPAVHASAPTPTSPPAPAANVVTNKPTAKPTQATQRPPTATPQPPPTSTPVPPPTKVPTRGPAATPAKH